jgi:uncharacterized membrane protein
MAKRTGGSEPALAGHVDQNVETIGALVSRAEQKITRHQRAVEALTSVIGRPRTVYVIIGLVIAWVLFNVGAPRLGLHRVDEPPFFWMQGALGLAALLTTVMVLTTQNRQMKLASERAHLDLQVNLLTEQKVAKLIALVEELRRDLPNVKDRRDFAAEHMQDPVDPAAVVSALEQTLGQATDSAIRAEDNEKDG